MRFYLTKLIIEGCQITKKKFKNMRLNLLTFLNVVFNLQYCAKMVIFSANNHFVNHPFSIIFEMITSKY